MLAGNLKYSWEPTARNVFLYTQRGLRFGFDPLFDIPYYLFELDTTADYMSFLLELSFCLLLSMKLPAWLAINPCKFSWGLFPHFINNKFASYATSTLDHVGSWAHLLN